MNVISWDDLFMTMVYLVAMKSKDQSTHIGAVIVDNKNRVVSVGYNGFPRGINDEVPERQEKPEKYYWFAHGERNALDNVASNMEGCRMYTNGIPCMDCARGIVQKGIKEVIVDREWDSNNMDIWIENADRTKQMFKEAGVSLRFYDGEFVQIKKFRRGQEFLLKE